MTWRTECQSCDFESADSLEVLEHEWTEHSVWNAREREWRARARSLSASAAPEES